LSSVTLTDDLYSRAVRLSYEGTSTKVLAFRPRAEGTPSDKTVLHTAAVLPFVAVPLCGAKIAYDHPWSVSRGIVKCYSY